MVSGKANTHLKYELFLIFERFRGFSVKEIMDKLNKDSVVAPRTTIYHWHQRYVRADRKARELTKGW